MELLAISFMFHDRVCIQISYDSINKGAVLTSKQTKIVILTSSRTFPNSHVAVNVQHFSLKRSKLNESIESGGLIQSSKYLSLPRYRQVFLYSSAYLNEKISM